MAERIIAVGDTRGCAAALVALVQAIDPTPLDPIIFLGDYIDRGPDSRRLVHDRLRGSAERSIEHMPVFRPRLSLQDLHRSGKRPPLFPCDRPKTVILE